MEFGRMIRAGLAGLALASAPAAFAEEVQELNWDDLMPDGEYEILNQLVEEYIAGLEAQYGAMQVEPLSADAELPTDLPMAGEAMDPFAEGGALDFMPQLGTFNTVDDLDGLLVRIPGYVVPLEFNTTNTYTEFLLVPSFGDCLHNPPPPPNRIIYVTSDEPTPIASIFDPIWVEGRMTTERHENEIGSAAYSLALAATQEFRF